MNVTHELSIYPHVFVIPPQYSRARKKFIL